MGAVRAVSVVETSSPVRAIVWGGLAAGVLDFTAAVVRWGHPLIIARSIASGLLGQQAFQGGNGIVVLGIALHFLDRVVSGSGLLRGQPSIYFSRARGRCVGDFLYGIAVYMFMTWVVVPLSAVPSSKAPFSMVSMALGLLTHMFCVGLPIGLAVNRYSR